MGGGGGVGGVCACVCKRKRVPAIHPCSCEWLYMYAHEPVCVAHILRGTHICVPGCQTGVRAYTYR